MANVVTVLLVAFRLFRFGQLRKCIIFSVSFELVRRLFAIDPRVNVSYLTIRNIILFSLPVFPGTRRDVECLHDDGE